MLSVSLFHLLCSVDGAVCESTLEEKFSGDDNVNRH